MLEKQAILSAIEDLGARDRRHTLFGAQGHRYRLNPPLAEETMAAFERAHGVRFPEEYRFFITQIGNGGAGPYYGVLRLGEDDGGHPWERGHLVGDISQPFPHHEAWNLPETFWAQEPDWPEGTDQAEQDRLMEAWDAILWPAYWAPAIMSGAIPICHLGCGLRHWLIVSGPCRGEIWADRRLGREGLAPVIDGSGQRMTFDTWYRAWLDEALKSAPGLRWMTFLSRIARRSAH